MAHIIEDRVMETTTTTGTGNISLAGAVTGFSDFDSVMANGDTCYYMIEAVDGSGVPTGDWETGLGTFNDTDTLVRTAVYRSTNSNAAVSFAAGTKRVSLAATAEMLSYAGGDTVDKGVLHVQDQKASGTDGGTFTSGAWQTRTLNTTVVNTITGASLASNQITLPAGTYDIWATAPAHQVDGHQARLQNTTDATTTLLGSTERSRSTSTTDGSSTSVVKGRFTITATKVFELQHRCSTTGTTAGFGSGSAATWGTLVYADVLITKVHTGSTGGSTASGTSFPSSPATGQRFYRSDRNIEYFYDGTNWLSTQLFILSFVHANTAGLTADAIYCRTVVPHKGVYGLWLDKWMTDGFLTATASWDINLVYSNSANAQTTIATVNTTGYAANTHTYGEATINAQLSTNAFTLELRMDELSGTATVSCFGALSYRLMG